MIDLIEKTLAQGGDLEQVRSDLLNQANIDRTNRCNQIEHDYRIAVLIRECLLMEPKGTAGYAIAKGVMNRLHEQYREKTSPTLVRKLKKAAQEEPIKQEREVSKDDRTEEESGQAEATV